MDQVDVTIFTLLDAIGCKFPKDVTSISQFDSNNFYEASAACLSRIFPENKYVEKLPGGQAGRFRACQQASQSISELGYVGELGYQAFLYPNEKDMRKLLMWLVDKMPRSEGQEEAQEEILGAGAVLNASIVAALQVFCSQKWSPVQASGTVAPFRAVPLSFPIAKSAEAKRYVAQLQPTVTAQVPQRNHALASVLEATAKELEVERLAIDKQPAAAKRASAISAIVGDAFRGVSTAFSSGANALLSDEAVADANKSAFSRRTIFAQESNDTTVTVRTGDGFAEVDKSGEMQVDDDAVRQQREEELTKLNERLRKLNETYAKMQDLTQQYTAGHRQLEGELSRLLEQNKQLEEAYLLKKRVLDMLPNAAKNIEDLENVASAASKKLVTFAQEWEKHRAPMVEQIRSLKIAQKEKKDEVGEKVDRVKRLRADLRDKKAQIHDKDAQLKQLQDELEKQPKSTNRQVYVRRIMEIVRSLDKQKEEIKKIIDDVKRVQKDINTVSGSSARSFALADEMVFAAAKNKKDEAATQAYKYVVELRQGFVELVKTIDATGDINNETRDLVSQIESLEARNTNLNMERIQSDLEQAKKENAALKAQLAAVAGGGKLRQ